MRWMLAREAACDPVRDPYWRALQTAEGWPFWLSDACGDFTAEAPPQLHDFKGGFFCDEPGAALDRPRQPCCTKAASAMCDDNCYSCQHCAIQEAPSREASQAGMPRKGHSWVVPHLPIVRLHAEGSTWHLYQQNVTCAAFS